MKKNLTIFLIMILIVGGLVSAECLPAPECSHFSESDCKKSPNGICYWVGDSSPTKNSDSILRRLENLELTRGSSVNDLSQKKSSSPIPASNSEKTQEKQMTKKEAIDTIMARGSYQDWKKVKEKGKFIWKNEIGVTTDDTTFKNYLKEQKPGDLINSLNLIKKDSSSANAQTQEKQMSPAAMIAMIEGARGGSLTNPYLFGLSGPAGDSKYAMTAQMLMSYDEAKDDYTAMIPMALAMTDQFDKPEIHTIMNGRSLGKRGASYTEALGTLLYSSLDAKTGMPNLQSLGLGLALYAATYRTEEREIIEFDCNAWEAPVGGNYCEECNKEDMPCGEYQCKSLGQACELVNADVEGEEALCYWAHRSDTQPPTIEPWEEILDENYKYKEVSSGEERAYEIIYKESSDGCIPAFTTLRFGVTADEPAKCKVDYLRKNKFDDMDYYMGGSSTFKYNHSEILKLPGPGEINSPEKGEEQAEIFNDGNWNIYVRCSDPNGHYNVKNLVFKFCVDEGPDTTAPLITTTSLLNGMAVAYGKNSIGFDLYTDEVAECRWDFDENKEYNEMENQMDCASNELEYNTMMLYRCSTTLTGIKDRTENKYYFRCKDKEGNENRESYEFILQGTQPLLIDSVKPNETIKGSTDTIKVTLEVETSAGYNEGEATCYFSKTGETVDYLMFYYDDGMSSYYHTQNLWLPEGSHTYYIKCLDLGGNMDTDEITFNVESDTEMPFVVRAYPEENNLKIVTSEEAECVYSKTDCNYLFEDGVKMTVIDETEHFTDWDVDFSYYIKCKDEYGNMPIPNQCSIIVRPTKTYEVDDDEG